MSYQRPSNERLRGILENTKTIAVVGLSDQPERESYQITKAMQQSGYRIIPVNPTISETLGEKAYKSLLEINEPFEVVNVFRRSEHLPEIAEQAIQTNANVFWAQQGIFNEEAVETLSKHNFTIVMDSCIKVAHSILVRR